MTNPHTQAVIDAALAYYCLHSAWLKNQNKPHASYSWERQLIEAVQAYQSAGNTPSGYLKFTVQPNKRRRPVDYAVKPEQLLATITALATALEDVLPLPFSKQLLSAKHILKTHAATIQAARKAVE